MSNDKVTIPFPLRCSVNLLCALESFAQKDSQQGELASRSKAASFLIMKYLVSNKPYISKDEITDLRAPLTEHITLSIPRDLNISLHEFAARNQVKPAQVARLAIYLGTLSSQE